MQDGSDLIRISLLAISKEVPCNDIKVFARAITVNRCTVVNELPVVQRTALANLSNEMPLLNFPVGM